MQELEGNPNHLEIVKEGHSYLNRWRNQNKVLTLNLFGADLHGFNLSGANLSGANLSGANLNDANLQDANLEYSNLQRANLHKAKLQRASLWGTDLQDANLQDTNFQETNFQGANLQKANLQKANLQGARFCEADLEEANLQGADLQKASLQRAKLQRAELQRANFRGANLLGANIQGANLLWTDLSGANLTNTNFGNAELFLTKLMDTILINTNFIDSKRSGISVSDRSALSEVMIDNFSGFIFVDELHNEADFIIRQIIFPPELLSSGVDIINYFSTVLCQKYKDRVIKVRVEQDGERVTMIVETDKGEKKIIEDILNQYGLVTTGKKRPEDFLEDQLQVLELKNMLRAVEVKLEGKRDLLELERSRVLNLGEQVNILKATVAKSEEERVSKEFRIKALEDQLKAVEEKQKDMERQMAKRNEILADFYIEDHQVNKVKQGKEKQVLTIFILDLTGFSRLTTEERQSEVALLRGFGRPLLDIHSADLENTWGDAIITCFENPNDGLDCALKIIEHLKVEKTIARIGMSIGLVDIVYNEIRRTRDIDGDCVNQAARLEPLTEPGTVLVSPELRYHPDIDQSKYQFTKKTKPLKKAVGNLPAGSEIEVFEVSRKDQTS